MAFERSPLFFFLAIALGSFIGILIPIIGASGVFTEFSKYPVWDILKSIIIILLIYLIIIRLNIESKLKKILLLGLSLRVCALIAIGIFGVLPYTFDHNWDVIAGSLINDWRTGDFYTDFQSSDNVRYYTLLTTLVYFFLGHNPFFMILLNVIFGTLSILYVYKLSNELIKSKKIATVSALFIAIWPTHIMFSAMNMRDSLAIFLLILFIYYLVKWFRNFKPSTSLAVLVLYVLNFLIRSQNAILIMVAVAPFVVYFILKRTNPKLVPLAFMAFVGIFGVVIALVYSQGYFRYLSLDYISTQMEYRTDGGTGYLEWVDYSNWLDIILYAPLKLVYFLFSPFPWEVSNIDQLLVSIEGMVLLFMAFFILVYRKKIYYKIDNKFIFVTFVAFCLIGLTANGIIDSNSGTAMRHKLQYIYMFFILFSAARYKKRNVVTLRFANSRSY